MLFLYKQLPVGMIIYHCSVNSLETEDFFQKSCFFFQISASM